MTTFKILNLLSEGPSLEFVQVKNQYDLEKVTYYAKFVQFNIFQYPRFFGGDYGYRGENKTYEYKHNNQKG